MEQIADFIKQLYEYYYLEKMCKYVNLQNWQAIK